MRYDMVTAEVVYCDSAMAEKRTMATVSIGRVFHEDEAEVPFRRRKHFQDVRPYGPMTDEQAVKVARRNLDDLIEHLDDPEE